MAGFFSSSTKSSADQNARGQKATGGSLVAGGHDRHGYERRVSARLAVTRSTFRVWLSLCRCSGGLMGGYCGVRTNTRRSDAAEGMGER